MNILIILLEIINMLIGVYLVFSFYFNLKNHNLREANVDCVSIFMVVFILILLSSIL